MSDETVGAPRRLDGWGFLGESYPASARLLRWLGDRLGEARPFPSFDADAAPPLPPPAAVPDLGCAAGSEPLDRLAHSRGRGFADLVRLRSATVGRLCDAVARPTGEAELEALLTVGERLFPFGAEAKSARLDVNQLLPSPCRRTRGLGDLGVRMTQPLGQHA